MAKTFIKNLEFKKAGNRNDNSHSLFKVKKK